MLGTGAHEGAAASCRPNQSTFRTRGLFVLAAAALLGGCSTTTPASPSYPRSSPVSSTAAESRSHVVTASWYGPGFNGNRTASGEVFHQSDLTAASRTLPLGTHVRVTNLVNGRSVVVRINDRGPFVSGRSIDLSRSAAERIGMAREGVGTVKLSELDDGPRRAAMLSTLAPATPVSYARPGDTLFAARYGTWPERPREWIGQVKMTLHGSHYRSRRHRHYAETVSNPVGTWLISGLPQF